MEIFWSPTRQTGRTDWTIKEKVRGKQLFKCLNNFNGYATLPRKSLCGSWFENNLGVRILRYIFPLSLLDSILCIEIQQDWYSIVSGWVMYWHLKEDSQTSVVNDVFLENSQNILWDWNSYFYSFFKINLSLIWDFLLKK